MKKLSSPPMVIILDVVFMMIFVLILQETPHIQIKVPSKVWLDDMILVSVNNDAKVKHWYDFKDDKWKTLDSFSTERNYGAIIGNIECDTNNICLDTVSPSNNEKKRIFLKGDLYDTISSLISDSCLKYPESCVGVKYYINDQGKVDLERLKQEFPIFTHILYKK